MTEPTTDIILADLRARAVELIGTAESLTITNEEEFKNASQLTRAVVAYRKEVEDAKKAARKPLLDELKTVSEPFEELLEQANRAERVGRTAVADYHARREELRRQEEARLRDQQAKEQARLAARAEKAEAAGKAEQADALREQAAMPAPILPAATPAIKGQSFREEWDYEVVDAAAVKPEFKCLDEKRIGATVRANKELAAEIVGGIRVFKTQVPVFRR